jgi:dipeptidyl aminopeptidase/acylaminoacyl peptidase
MMQSDIARVKAVGPPSDGRDDSGIRAFLEAPVADLADVGEGGLVLVEWDARGTRQLHLVLPDRGVVQLTEFDDPVAGLLIPHSASALIVRDERGNERSQLLVAPLRPGSARLRPLVVDARFVHRAPALSRDGRLLAYATNRRNGADLDIAVRSLVDGRERHFPLGGFCTPAGFSPGGRWLAVLRDTELGGDNDLLLIDVATGAVRQPLVHDPPGRIGEPAWLPGDAAFFVGASLARDSEAVLRCSTEGAWELVRDSRWDLSPLADPTGRVLLVEENVDGYSRLELLDAATLRPIGEVPQPGRGVVERAKFSPEGTRLVYSFSSAREPGDVWTYDVRMGELSRLTRPARPLEPSQLAEPTLHRVPSFDGTRVPVWLHRPRRRGPAPAVVVLHGGPESQARPRFSGWIQFLVSQGYAVAVPNVRGSTGYGKAYEHLDDRTRRLDAARDVAAVGEWLAARREVDAKKIVLYGRSYGGFLALATLALTPDRWAAGIEFAGISNLATFLENTAPWRRRVREGEYGTLAGDRDFLVAVSPLTHADRIRAPLFIQHGANDPRVPLQEALQIHDALAARGVRCELVVHGDEGHRLERVANRVDAYERAAHFLSDVLGTSEAARSGASPAAVD